MLRSERPFELPRGKVRVLNSRQHEYPYAKTWVNSNLRLGLRVNFRESVTVELSVTCKWCKQRPVQNGRTYNLHPFSFLLFEFHTCMLEFCKLQIVQNLSSNHNVIVFQCLKYCGKMPKFILSKPNIIWTLKVISTSLCHVRKTIKRNKHEQKGYTLKKRLFLPANYNPMISQPLPRVFTFYNMAKAGEENQYGF